jgi:hypothetical protein
MTPEEFTRGVDLVTNTATWKINQSETRIEVMALFNKYTGPSGIFNKLKVPDSPGMIEHIRAAISSVKSSALRKIVEITKKELEITDANNRSTITRNRNSSSN